MRVLLLPSVPYEPLWRLHAAGEHPRPMVTEELRRDHGIIVDSIDPDTGWRNPFGRKAPFYRAFDPLRILRVLIARRDYDLVVSGNDSAAAALVALRWLFRFRTPIVIWDLSPAMRWRIRILTQDRTIPRVDGVIALNDIQQPYIARRWGAHVPVIVVNHWVDTDFYQPGPSEARGTILAVGDDSGRDYPTLLRALEGLSARTLIRTGLPLDLNQHHAAVTVLSDRLTPRAFRDLYADSQFVVVPLHPDTKNASGISTILEAAAMGKAVIVSDSDGIRGFVRHDETGLVVPANDPISLREAIGRLLREPETCDRLGREARRYVERTASPAIFAERLATAFRALGRHRVISPPPSPA
jgi:glycosyltransferase involved in cell wall biosynthesis